MYQLITLYKRLFQYQPRTASGCDILSWIFSTGSVWLKKHVRNSKYDSLINEVELNEANRQYAHIRHSTGTEITVFICHLAPKVDENNIAEQNIVKETIIEPAIAEHNIANDLHNCIANHLILPLIICKMKSYMISHHTPLLRCSERISQAPERMDL